MKIPVEVSARHVHLSEKAVEALFGKGYKLTFKKELSQPGQFLCCERVNIVGPRGSLENVAILGPTRQDTQIEISITDSIKIGKNYVIRESGDLDESESCTLSGPAGSLELDKGLIVAKRHIHLAPQDAEKLGVVDGQLGSIKINSSERSLVYNDVVMRVNKNFSLAMHIDTDESNAACAFGTVYGEIVK